MTHLSFTIARIFYRWNVWNLYSLKVYIRYRHSLIYIISICDLHLVGYNLNLSKGRDKYSKFLNCRYRDRRLSSTLSYIISSYKVSNILSWSNPFNKGSYFNLNWIHNVYQRELHELSKSLSPRLFHRQVANIWLTFEHKILICTIFLLINRLQFLFIIWLLYVII